MTRVQLVDMTKRISNADAAAEMISAGLEPLESYPGAVIPWRCRCTTCGREVTPRFNGIRNGQGGCRHCGRRKVAEKMRVPEEEAVAEMRAKSLEPLEPYINSVSPWLCRCITCGREVTPTLASIRNGRGGCIHCAGLAKISEEEAVAEMIAAALEPLKSYSGRTSPWLCRCITCGREVTPTLASIRNGRGGCIHCAGLAKISEEEAVAEMRTVGVEPLEPYPGMNSSWLCRCTTCGREVTPRLGNIRHGGGGGCKYCGGTTKVEDQLARIEMIAAGVEPLEPYVDSVSPWLCRCVTCGREVTPSLKSIRNGRGGCIHCARNALVDSDVAVAEMIAAGVEPLEPYINSVSPWLCRCITCGREVTPRLGNIRSGSGGCKYCSDHGMKLAEPALVYLLRHEKLGAYKVGITNLETKNSRTEYFIKLGWEVFRTIPLPTGGDAYEVEQAVLDHYRILNLSPYLTKDELPNGHSETIDAEAVGLLELWAEIEDAAKAIQRLSSKPIL